MATNETGYYNPAGYRSHEFKGAATNSAVKKARFDPPGLTIVGEIRHDERFPIDRLIARFREAATPFTGFPEKPHVTFHGILAYDQPQLTAAQRIEIVSVAGEIIDEVFAGVGPFRLSLTQIAHGGNKRNPLPDIVWMASEESARTVAR